MSGRIRLQVLLLAGGLMLALGIVATGTAVEVTSRPDFCGSCHIMKPYFESWTKSTHHNVACVECHIPPGFKNEFRKKYEALSMVASYFTGTYGTNPWTEIDDAACLVCHERRLLSGKELFGDILFDHSAHLAGMRRGKSLRCTSCHSQIVQGSHIAVTASTCILCHFKDQPSGTGTARCTLCHQVPDKVIHQGTLTFNHGDVSRFGMECTWCHARPAGSNGDVPRERCTTCHNEPARLQEYANTELLHQKHVTEHKVNCTYCHLEIQHVGPAKIEAAATACGSCHLSGHSPQMSLYTGIGGKGVGPMPSPMFLAGVRCEGCHLDIPGHTSETRRASEVSCMSCHGPSYRRIFLDWKSRLETRTAAMEGQMRQTVVAMKGATQGAMPGPLADARFNLDLVSRGHGIHNVDYALALLTQAHKDLNSARSSQGLAALPPPWSEAPYETPCLRCHQGIEQQEGRVFSRRYLHAPHVVEAKLQCVTCHLPHDERPAADKHQLLKFEESGCESCHHREPIADCLACHRGIRTGTIKTKLGQFSHAFHLDEAGQTCKDCHDLAPGKPVGLKQEHCAECHG
ncbi:MAG TPA: cytochrome c3 family protein [Patescibacteria group bacterium]|nr:cytochrome c3 family protein [Patescibacteria group bacterium]